MVRSRLKLIFIGIFIKLLISCNDRSKTGIEPTDSDIMVKKSNPVVYFEIPVSDIERATVFYSTVFNVDFQKEIIDNNEMLLFPFSNEKTGISGALAKGEIYKPTNDGVLLYFGTDNIDATLEMVTSIGGKILYPKTDNGIGLVAEFEDSEGNRIALYQSKEL